ncbi:MAG TPA: WYL domain-containing protein [Nocardioidaceae bacterium]|nr:WYL domain-containing protein [Nocardioidaceae bacterium]
MTARKSERLLNLLITLLVARSYVTKERIRSVVEQYREAGDEAFEKMFERDKDELRSLGVPIEVGHLDPAFEAEPGYRVERSAFELPDITLEPEEAAVIGLAARVWQHAGMAEVTSDALVKLKSAGVDVDRSALHVVQPQLTADEPAFEPFWEAVRTRTAVSFDYRSSASALSTPRHLEPWGVVSYHGRWYVVGHDRDRDAPRLFRLSRVSGAVTLDRKRGTFTVPAGTDVRALTQALAPRRADLAAVVLARAGGAQGLRRHAIAAADSDTAPTGWDRLTVSYADPAGLADEVLGYGADVIVEQPDEVRALVIERLRAAAGAEEAS